MPQQWQRVKQVLEEAWDRDVAGRAALLEETCAGDPALRARIEALLAADERAVEFLAAPVVDVARAMAAAASGDPDADRSDSGYRRKPGTRRVWNCGDRWKQLGLQHLRPRAARPRSPPRSRGRPTHQGSPSQ